MPKKKSSKNISSNIPATFADPKFSDLQKLLLESSRPLDKYWKKTNVARFFEGKSEEQRKEMAPFCMKWYQFLRKTCPDEYRDHLPSFFPDDATVQHAFLTVKVAILACGSRAEAQKVFREVGASFVESAVEKVLRSRKPEWASDFLLSIARHPRLMHHSSKMYWRIYRQLVMEKIAEPIFDEFWIRTMFSCELSATGLKNDPGLLESDIWALFEFSSFPGSWSLTSHDNGDRWKNAFASLIAEGRIDKRRVIDGCFQSISKPFSDHQVKWYVQLLELMMKRKIIILEEQAADSRFPGLLENSNPTPRALGLKILEQLVGSNLIADKDVLRYIPSIFREPVKGKAKKALTLLERIAKKNKNIRNDVCRTALEGLQHEAAEIQQGTLDLLLKYDAFSDASIMESVRKIATSLPVSLQQKIPGRITVAKTPANKTSKSPLPPLARKYEPIEPIKNFDELIDLAAKLVEEFEEIDDVERFLDGLARLGNDKPDDFVQKTAPLLERTKKLIATAFLATHPENRRDLNENTFEFPFGHCPFDGREIMLDFRFAVISWIIGELPCLEAFPKPVRLEWSYWHPNHRTFSHFVRHGEQIWYSDNKWISHENPTIFIISKRIETVVKNICSKKTIPLLSAPTHHGGWIDPNVFVQRLIEAKAKHIIHDDGDKVLALTRLMPINRETALKTFEHSKPPKGEWADAVRHALGAEKIKIGKTPHYWIAAARCRTPLEDVPALENAFPGYGPDAGVTATYRFEIRKVQHAGETLMAVPGPDISKNQLDWTLFPLLALHSSPHQDWRERDGLFPWFLSIWPQNLDPAIAVSISSHLQNIDKNYDYGFRYALKAMASPTVSLRPIGVAALFLGLGMKSPLVHTAAMDTMIMLIGDGRLTSEAAVTPVRELLGLKVLTTSRWVPHLKTISDQSGHYAAFIFELLENILDLLPSKDLGGFLELMNEIALASEKTIRNIECRRFLEALTGSGKAAKLAKKLLEL